MGLTANLPWCFEAKSNLEQFQIEVNPENHGWPLDDNNQKLGIR